MAAGAAAAGLTAGIVLVAGDQGSEPVVRPSSPRVLSPFTGEPVKRLGPVLAVKIDNIRQARPQTGLSKADIVYVLPVEGGLSRFLAIFSARIPPVIGPVRSARETDLQLLRQFGRPAFAFSGAHPHLLPVIERARIVDLYSGRVSGYFRDHRRVAPYNLYGRGARLQQAARDADHARDIGFRFGPAPRGGRPAAAESVSYPAASFTFTWLASQARWLVRIDGQRAGTAEDGQLSAATVVIQDTAVKKSRFNSLSPFAQSVGAGKAIVLRDGRAYQARWSRPSADGGTAFRTAGGQPMTFARGPVWIILTKGPA